MPHLPPIAGKVARLIDASLRHLTPQRSVKEIARMSGMSATMLSMVRYGRNKLPLENVSKLAATLEIDPRQLLRLAMDEGMRPEAVNVIFELLGALVTANEMTWVSAIRNASSDTDPELTSDMEEALGALFRT